MIKIYTCLQFELQEIPYQKLILYMFVPLETYEAISLITSYMTCLS